MAAHWYANVYRPAVELIAAAAPIGQCANATESDAFLWLCERRRELSVEHAALQFQEALLMSQPAGGRQGREPRLSRRPR